MNQLESVEPQSMYSDNQSAIILIKVHKLHLIVLVLLYPLVHLLLNLQLILLRLICVIRKIVKCQLAFLILPVSLCNINRVLSDIHACVNVLV